MEGKIPIDEKPMFRTAGHFCMGWRTAAVSVNERMYEVAALIKGAPGNLLTKPSHTAGDRSLSKD